MSGRRRLGKYSLRIGTVSCEILGLSCTGMGLVAPPGAGGGACPWNGAILSLGSRAGP